MTSRFFLTKALLLLALGGLPMLALACRAPAGETGGKGKKNKDGKDEDEDHKVKPPPPRPIEHERVVRALEGEVAGLKRALAEGKASARTGLINAHEHLYEIKHLERYLPAARQAGIAATVFVASPQFTIMGSGDKGEPMMSDNFATILEAKKLYPTEVIPFCTLDPHDADKLERLKRHVAEGCLGLKLYSGHSNFFKDHGPFDAPGMDEVYSYLEETQLPVNWHVNLAKFMSEFQTVIEKHPKMNLMVPHYGVVFWSPKGPALEQLKTLMRAHKNLLVDTSLGTREILLNGMASMEPALDDFRAFFLEFQDQIVWGTDSVVTGNQEKTPGWYAKVIWATRDQLEKDVFSTELAAGYSKYYQKGRDGEGRYQGLALPPEVLQKVQVDNARRWLKLK
ncbi:MAG: amidohydrolase family protein [Deltaproteobacteria bacterium]|nr:amidohydrolase family protein [Deltaproteobacteria bacterium]